MKTFEIYDTTYKGFYSLQLNLVDSSKLDNTVYSNELQEHNIGVTCNLSMMLLFRLIFCVYKIDSEADNSLHRLPQWHAPNGVLPCWWHVARARLPCSTLSGHRRWPISILLQPDGTWAPSRSPPVAWWSKRHTYSLVVIRAGFSWWGGRAQLNWGH